MTHKRDVQQGTLALMFRRTRRASENNRRAKYYTVARAGKTRLGREVAAWEETHRIMGWFLPPMWQP
jgi:hypothetical protein